MRADEAGASPLKCDERTQRRLNPTPRSLQVPSQPPAASFSPVALLRLAPACCAVAENRSQLNLSRLILPLHRCTCCFVCPVCSLPTIQRQQFCVAAPCCAASLTFPVFFHRSPNQLPQLSRFTCEPVLEKQHQTTPARDHDNMLLDGRRCSLGHHVTL